MDVEDRIESLRAYRDGVVAWDESMDRSEFGELRRLLNEKKAAVQRDVIEAGCLKTLTIAPPPALGGLVMRNVNPFDAMFDPPYGMSLVDVVLDMIDETIGIMSTPEFQVQVKETEISSVQVEDELQPGYTFIAMPMDPDDSQLEDVLDAIKEACTRCGLRGERVDEPESNDRITDRILESIRRAEYVIVDLTYSKPNVFYEAGYAQGRGKTPIYVARQGTHLEFDLKDYPVIFFRNMKQLKDALERRIRGLAETDL